MKCSGHENGKVTIDVAVLIVHAGRVYIFSCDSDEGKLPRRAFRTGHCRRLDGMD